MAFLGLGTPWRGGAAERAESASANTTQEAGRPPAASTTGDMVPGDMVPGDMVPGDIVPGNTVPGNTVPEDAPSAEASGDAPAVESTGGRDDNGTGWNVGDLEKLDLADLLNLKVVVAASGTRQRVADAPAIVTVVSREDIELWGYQSVAEVLRHVTGFYVIDDHVSPNVALRGVSGGLRSESGLFKVMIDSRPVTFRPTAGNWLGPELVPFSALDRIEIVRGPTSAIYGADAFLGVINVVTRSPQEPFGVDFRMGVQGAGGARGGLVDGTLNGHVGRLNLLLAGRFVTEERSGLRLPASSPAPRVPSYNQDRRVSAGMRHRAASAMARVTYALSDHNQLRADAHYAFSDRSAEFADWLQLARGTDANGIHSENRIALGQGFVSSEWRLGVTEAFDLQLQGLFFFGGPLSQDRLEVGSPVFYVRRHMGSYGLDSGLTVRWQISDSIHLLLASSLSVDWETTPGTEKVLKYSVGDTEVGSTREIVRSRPDDELVWVNPGAHMQARWTPWQPDIQLTAGVRFDHHTAYGRQISGRVAAISTPKPDLSFKLLYGNAFKAPSPLLLYAVPTRPGDVMGNPRLDAQRIHTTEAQASYRFLTGLSASLVSSYSYLSNRAEFMLRGVNRVATNIAEMHNVTVEGSIELTRSPWRAYANATWQRTWLDMRSQGYAESLVGREGSLFPRFVLNLGAHVEFPALPLRLGIEGAVVTSRRASAMNILDRGEPYDLPPYVLLDGILTTEEFRFFGSGKTTLALIGRNLLNAAGPDPGFGGVDYPLPGARIMLELRQRFL